MATEEKIILSADVTKAAGSVAELKAQIKELRDTIDAETTSVEDAATAAELLKVKQQALRAVMAGSAEAFTAVLQATEGTTKSYNTLVTEMAKLKAAWRASTDEVERANLGKQINTINDQLKALDASTGNFQRNVGDYANQMTKAFQMTAGSAGSLINPIQGVNGAMKALSSTPVIAILGLLANIIMSVITNMKKSEEGMTALTQAFSAFQVIGDFVCKVLEAVGSALAKVITWIGEMTAALIDNNEAMEKKIRLHELEQQMLVDERDNIKKNAEAERDVAKLRAESADKINYTAEERIAKLKEAGRLEEEISKRNLQLAKKDYEAWQLRNEPTKSSAEDLKAEAEAYAKVLQAESALYNKQREINAQITEATRQVQSERAKAAKEHEAQLQRQAEAEAKAARASAEAEQQSIQETKQFMVNRMSVMKKGSYDQLAMAVEIKQYEIDTLAKMDRESDAQYEARKIALHQQLKEAQMALVDQGIKAEKEALELNIAKAEGDAVAELQARAELAKYTWETTYQGMNESHEAYLKRKLEAEKAYKQAEMEAESYDKTKEDLEAQLQTLEQNSIAYLDKQLELKRYELDTLHKLEYESEEHFQHRMIELKKEYNEADKKLTAVKMQTAMQYVQAVGGLLNSLAAIYESDTDASEEELQKAKNLKIAGAVMSTIEGAVNAYMSGIASGIPSPGNMILAVMQAATATAAGMANVRQLASTDVSKDSSSASVAGVSASGISLPSSSGAVTQAPALDTVIESVRTVTTASEEESLNRSQKVYLVTDELEMAQNARKVRMTESTF